MTTYEGSRQLPSGTPGAHSAKTIRRAPVARRIVGALRANEEHAWRGVARVASLIPLAALVFAITVLAVKAWPSIVVNGTGFITGSSWNPGSTYAAITHTHGVAHPVGASYGLWPLIVGTFQTSAIAVILALPLSIGAAFALTERMPGWISRPLGFAIELLAGVPSVLIGLWGVLTLGPFLANHIYPHIAAVMPDVPVLRYFRAPTGHGLGLLTAGIVLALMIVPIIASTTRDLFAGVPPLPKDGASALGMTDAEVARRVTLPWVRSGIIGATVLGLGRALGETIAVFLITGSILHIAPNIYSPMSTIAALIVGQLDSAGTDGTGFAVSALAEAGLVLAVMSVAVNLIARMIVNRTGRLTGPVGRG